MSVWDTDFLHFLPPVMSNDLLPPLASGLLTQLLSRHTASPEMKAVDFEESKDLLLVVVLPEKLCIFHMQIKNTVLAVGDGQGRAEECTHL